MLESQQGDVEAAIEVLLEMAKDSAPSGSGSSGGGRATVAPEAPQQHPILERDTQIRTDEALARHMQDQIFSEALQEQTPTCFSPITGLLSGSTARGGFSTSSQGDPRQGHQGQPATLADTVGGVWSAVSAVGQSIASAASTWMAPAEEDDEDDGDDGEMGAGREAPRPAYMDERETRPLRGAQGGAQSAVQRRKPQASKKSD